MQDLPASSPLAKKMLEKLNLKELIEVPRQPQGPAGVCYWLVQAYIEQQGGSMALGWLVNVVPGVYVNAMHHAVWRMPDGRLVDVTASEYGPPAPGTTTFAPDDSISVDLRFPVLVESQHVVLVEDPVVEEALAQYRVNNRIHREADAAMRDSGLYTWAPGSNYAGPPLPDALRQKFEALSPSYERMHELRALIRSRYFPLMAPR